MNSYALLSVRNHPLINFLLKQLKIKNCLPKAIIFDNKNLSKEELFRYCDRTGEIYSQLIPFQGDGYEIKVFDVFNHNSKETSEIIKKLKLSFLVNGGTPRILKKIIVENTAFGVLNCHPGLLPDYRGCSCVEWAIFNNDPVGNSIHWMNEGIDSGPIILKKETKYYMSDNYENLRKRVYLDGFNLLADLIYKICKCPRKDFTKLYKGEFINGGNLYKPIDEFLLQEVKEKLINKSYKFKSTYI